MSWCVKQGSGIYASFAQIIVEPLLDATHGARCWEQMMSENKLIPCLERAQSLVKAKDQRLVNLLLKGHMINTWTYAGHGAFVALTQFFHSGWKVALGDIRKWTDMDVFQ